MATVGSMPSDALGRSAVTSDHHTADSISALLSLLAAADGVVVAAPPEEAIRILRAVEDGLAGLALVALEVDVARCLLRTRDDLSGYVLAAVLVDEVTVAASSAAASLLRRGIASTTLALQGTLALTGSR
jgi:cobalamin synthase